MACFGAHFDVFCVSVCFRSLEKPLVYVSSIDQPTSFLKSIYVELYIILFSMGLSLCRSMCVYVCVGASPGAPGEQQAAEGQRGEPRPHRQTEGGD